jgi:hypothetical protein
VLDWIDDQGKPRPFPKGRSSERTWR